MGTKDAPSSHFWAFGSTGWCQQRMGTFQTSPTSCPFLF